VSHSGLSAFDAAFDPSDICANVLNSGEFMNLKVVGKWSSEFSGNPK
jgi:hypothetical protein